MYHVYKVIYNSDQVRYYITYNRACEMGDPITARSSVDDCVEVIGRGHDFEQHPIMRIELLDAE
jgi:hypothetical protein